MDSPSSMKGASSSGGSSTCCKCLFWAFSMWTRLVALGYCAFAFWGCWELRHLLVGDDAMDSFEIDGDTLKVPLVLCLPTALVIDNVVYTTRTSAEDAMMMASNCRSLDYMVYAVAISLLLSGLGVIVFLMVDACGRCSGHMQRNRNLGTDARYRRMASPTVAGMCLLLLFMLVQTAVSAGALVEQLNAWTNTVADIIKVAPTAIDDSDSGMSNTTDTTTSVPNPAADIDHVEPLANLWILAAAASLAFSAAFWILLDALIIYPCRPTSAVEDDFHADAGVATSVMEQQRLSVETQAVTPSQAFGVKSDGVGNNAALTPASTFGSQPSMESSGSVTPFGAPTPSWTS